jgi:hypothetical protein
MSVVELSRDRTAVHRAAGIQETSLLFQRLSGVALVTGAITFLIHLVARSVLTATAGGSTGVFATHSLWAPVNGLGAIGAALVILGSSGVHADLADSHDLLGLSGSVLTGVGWMVVGLFLSLYSMMVLPWLATSAPDQVDTLNADPAVIVTFGAGLLAQLAGTIMLALSFVRRQSDNRWIGYLLLMSALMLVLGNFVIAPSGPATNLAVNLVSNLGPMLLMLALGAVGYEL